MKKILTLLGCCMMAAMMLAQECFLPIGVGFKTTPQPLPAAQQKAVANKLRQLLTTTNGVAGNVDFHCFALVPEYEVLGKSVTPGPPKQIVYQLQLSLQVLNTADGVVYEAYTTLLDGVGNTEQAAFSDAVKRLAPRNKELTSFISRAQDKILLYYNSNVEKLIARARTLEQTRRYDEALSVLMPIPSCCSGYDEARQLVMDIWQHRINLESERLLLKAQSVWAAGQDAESARQAAALLAQADPESSSYAAAGSLMADIKKKAGEQSVWDIHLKVYDDSVDLARRRLEAAREVALAYAENQQEQTANITFVK
ncbi:MAG: hypothetical protein IJS95_05475 [Prevotella sp.]|nr:hypothetical protein [Prevotella sp.]